jgi:hypothetical protein
VQNFSHNGWAYPISRKQDSDFANAKRIFHQFAGKKNLIRSEKRELIF